MLYDFDCFTVINHTLNQSFPHVKPYVTEIPSYGTLWGFNIASNDPFPSLSAADIDELVEKRIRRRFDEEIRMERPDVSEYDGVAHVRMFTLPKFLREGLARETRVMTEEHQVLMY